MEYTVTRFITIIFLILVTGQTVLGAPVRVVTMNGKTYIVSDTKVPFGSIASGCSSLSGRPTTVTSDQEYRELVEALSQTDPPFLSSLWFSLTQDLKTGEWAWGGEMSSSALWFNNTAPFVQEPNNNGDNCNSLGLCICGSLTYTENTTTISADTHRLFDTCCTESHYFFCKDLNECACPSSDVACTAAAGCQEPTSQCLDLIGSYRCIDLLPSANLTCGSTSTTFSVGSQVVLNCIIPREDIPYKNDIPSETQWTFEWVKNGERVAIAASNNSIFTINSLSSDTEGSYQCLYSIGEVHSAKSASLDITVRPLTTPTLTATTADVAIGETVNLTCSTSSPGEKLYEWSLPSGATHQTSQNIYSFEMTGWQMQGVYTCRVNIPSLESSSPSSDPFVLGLKLTTPLLSTPGKTKSFALNETLTLRCTTTDSPSLPALTYDWKKDGETIQSSGSSPEYSFVVSHASIEGVYTCSTVYWARRSQASNKLTLQYKWSSVPELQTNITTLSPGLTVYFKCLSDEPGNIALDILKDDQAVLLDTAQCTGENSLHQECWNFPVTGPEDLGTYYCKAKVASSWSSPSNHVTLVRGAIETPTLTAEPHLGTVNLFSLICSVGVNNTHDENYHEFVYTFQVRTVNGTTRQITETSEPIVNITLAHSQDGGDYWCSVKHDWLVSNRSNVLHLAHAIYEVVIETPAVLVPKGKQVTIKCSPSWDEPQPRELSWLKDSNHIKTGTESSIVIREFHEEDEGAYTCQVYNKNTGQWISSNSTELKLLEPYQTCRCACTNTTVEVELSNELIEQLTSQIKKQLIVAGNLSMAGRRKNCATDNRASSTACGGASIVFLIVIIAFVIYIDGVNLSKLRKPWRGMDSKKPYIRELPGQGAKA